jgi:hypothetical protein
VISDDDIFAFSFLPSFLPSFVPSLLPSLPSYTLYTHARSSYISNSILSAQLINPKSRKQVVIGVKKKKTPIHPSRKQKPQLTNASGTSKKSAKKKTTRLYAASTTIKKKRKKKRKPKVPQSSLQRKRK